MTNKARRKNRKNEIDKSHYINVYTKVDSFYPALIRPPLRGPSLISAPAELTYFKIRLYDLLIL